MDLQMLKAWLNCNGPVNRDIDDAHFPGADASVSTKGVRPVEIPMDDWSITEAIAYLAAMDPPMQPVMPDKGIKYAAENPDVQRGNPLAILGQTCRLSARTVCFIVLGGDRRKRYAHLYGVQQRLRRKCLVLAELKPAAPTA